MPRKDLKARAEYGRAYYQRTKEARRPLYRKWNREYARRKRAANPQLGRQIRLQRMGLDEAAFSRLLVAQGGKCAICRCGLEAPYIDHDHAHCPKNQACRKCVRGLLCRSCNLGLGYFRDNIDFLIAAISYLVRRR